MIRADLINRKHYKDYIGKECCYDIVNNPDADYVVSKISKKYIYIRRVMNKGKDLGPQSDLMVKKDKVMILHARVGKTTSSSDYVIDDSPKWLRDLRKEYKYLIPNILSSIGNVDNWDIEEDEQGDILHYTVDAQTFSKQIKELAYEII